MSNTYHHRSSHHTGCGYGGRYQCNKRYSQPYGKFGRKRTAVERRQEDKRIVREELK